MTGARLAVLAAAIVLLGPVGPAAALEAAVDGNDAEWSAADRVGTSAGAPSDANATVDLQALYAADNATHWFFALTFTWTGASRNASLALYLLGNSDGSPAAADPLGHAVGFPAGYPLLCAVYFEITPAFPTTSRVTFFDGQAWKNRTFDELGISAALNESGGFLEVSALRASLPFVRAGTAAAVELVPPPGGAGGAKTLADAIPDATAPVAGRLAAVVPFFDYALNPPVAFTALGVSDTGASEGTLVQVFVELSNLGPKAISGLASQVMIDGVVAGSSAGLALLPFGTAVLQFNWTAVAGSHNVTATSSPGGATRSLPLVVRPAGSALRIVEAFALPSSPVKGATFQVEVRVLNAGAVPSPSTRLLVKDGTQIISSTTLAPVAANGSATVRLDARLARAGEVTLRVEIDGQTSSNASLQLALTVQDQASAFGLSGPIVLIVGVAASGAAAWFLAPRLHRKRGAGPPPPPETPPPLP